MRGVEGFAVVDAEGTVHEVEADLSDAVASAAGASTDVHILAEDGTGSALAGFGGFSDFGDVDFGSRPQAAMRLAGLKPVRGREVEAMSLDEAYERLVHFFGAMPFRGGGGGLPKKYESPAGMVDAFIGQNYKTSIETAEAPSDVQGLSLLPYDMVLSNRTVGARGAYRHLPMRAGQGLCAGSNVACQRSCLVLSGQNWIDAYNVAVKQARTEALLLEPVAFCRMLIESIEKKTKAARRAGDEPFFRANVYSDIPWELFFPDMFEQLSGLQFYDYTKVPGREPPHNYDLTFSWSGTNQAAARFEISRGRRIAVVFLPPPEMGTRKARAVTKRQRGGEDITWLPSVVDAGMAKTLGREFLGARVLNGDLSDVRPRDPAPSVVGLMWKTPMVTGRSEEMKHSVFVVPVQRVGDAFVVTGNQRGTQTADADLAG